jgi:hypothetical protein
MHWTKEDLAAHQARQALDLTQANLQGGTFPAPAKTSSVLNAAKPKRKRGMNRWEAEYAQKLEAERLAGLIQWYGFEAMSLRLADGCRFTPDFAIVLNNGNVQFDEVKGHLREAARVRFKVAEEMYKHFRFGMFRKIPKKRGGGWERIQ